MRKRGAWRSCVLALLGLILHIGVLASTPASAAPPERPVVVVGMAGVQWDDVTVDTPALASLLDDGAAGNLVSRSVTATSCPIDGWLAVSTGKRAAAAKPVAACQQPGEPSGDGVVPGWSGYVDTVNGQSYGAEPGLLGDTLAGSGISAAAVGPGAAIALADSDGTVAGEYAGAATDPAALQAMLPEVVTASALTVVDLGTVDAGDSAVRAQQVAELDDRLAAVLAATEAAAPDATVLVASLADAASEPGLQLAWLQDGDSEGALNSPSTRVDGLIQATDITPTILDQLDVEIPADLGGSALQVGGASLDQRALVDAAGHASAVMPIVGFLSAGLVAVNLLLILAVAAFHRWRPRALASRPATLLSVSCAGLAALPASSFLANFVPWWRASSPGAAYAALVAGIAVGIAAVAYAGPWRRSRWGPPVVVSIATALALVADVIGLLPLQFAAPMGISPLVGGRFYGFGNSAFVLWATALLVIAAALAAYFVRRDRRRTAAICAAVIGVVCVVVDGAPSLGADFGGPPATLPAFAVLALLVLGIRITWRRAVLILAVCAVLALSISVADWLRPPSERSHLGRFVESVLSGDVGETLGRKLGQNLSNLVSSELTLLAIGGALFLIFVLVKDLRAPRSDSDAGVYGALRPLLIALSVCWGIAFLVNDSGVLLPAVGMMLAVPLLIGMWLRRRQPASSPAASEIMEYGAPAS